MYTESEKGKLFLAGSVPAELASRIETFQAKLKREMSGRGIELRWTKPESFHFTLFFLGQVPLDRVTEICAAATTVAAASPVQTIELRGTGAFPEDRAARVLWAGVRATRELRGLQQELSRAMTGLGFAADAREFHPHVTLARLRDARSVRDFVQMFRRHDFGEFSLRELALYRSHPAVPYPRYEALERFPLREDFSVSLSAENC